MVQARIVQIPMDEELIEALDRLSKQRGASRSALIRRACRELLERVRSEDLDRVYERGYRSKPDDPALAEAQTVMAGEVLAEERW